MDDAAAAADDDDDLAAFIHLPPHRLESTDTGHLPRGPSSITNLLHYLDWRMPSRLLLLDIWLPYHLMRPTLLLRVTAPPH